MLEEGDVLLEVLVDDVVGKERDIATGVGLSRNVERTETRRQLSALHVNGATHELPNFSLKVEKKI